MNTSVETRSTPAMLAAETRRPGLGATLAGIALGPARIGLAILVVFIIFQVLNSNFLRPANLSNLLLQIVPIAMISIGVVLVLLLGEIDLSVGAVSGLAGALLAVSFVDWGWSPYAAMGLALLVGALIGVFQGTAVVSLRVPSFIVTLSGLLAWQGAQLFVLGGQGTLIVNSPEIIALATSFLPDPVSIALAVIGLAVFVLLQVRRRAEQKAGRVEVEPWGRLLLRVGGVAALAVVLLIILLVDRGVPLGFLILIAVILLVNYIITGSRFGRHLLAVGGNEESARRVGIKVDAVKVVAFASASLLAAAGGILAVSRLQGATQSAGGGDLLLLAIAGPVIAGVSLFGGRGSVWGALVGAILIGAISNGMDLLGLDASIKYLVTGGVLFIAVALDALARMRRGVK